MTGSAQTPELVPEEQLGRQLCSAINTKAGKHSAIAYSDCFAVDLRRLQQEGLGRSMGRLKGVESCTPSSQFRPNSAWSSDGRLSKVPWYFRRPLGLRVSLRKVGWCPQKTLVLGGTVRENITMGRMDRLVDAVKLRRHPCAGVEIHQI